MFKNPKVSALVFIFPLALFILNSLLVIYSIFFPFNLWPILGPIFHFLGGALMAILFLNFFENHAEFYSFKFNWLAVLVLALGFVALAGLLWEFYEFGLDFFFPELAAQPSLEDTMTDLFLDLVGGLVLALFYFKSKLYSPAPFNK